MPLPLRSHLTRTGVADEARLAVVTSLGDLDERAVASLEAVVRSLAATCTVPVAVLNLVRPGLQRYVAEVGFGAPCSEVPDELSFCAEVVELGIPLFVRDALQHHVYADNPFVRAGAIRSYAGVPLVHRGAVVGTLSIFDQVVRTFGNGEVAALHGLAGQVQDILDASAPAPPVDPRLQAVLDALPDATVLVDERGVITAVNHAWRRFTGDHGGSPGGTDVGVDYLAVRARSAVAGSGHAARAELALRSVLAGSTTSHELEHRCPSPDEDCSFLVRITPVGGPTPGALVSHADIPRRRSSLSTRRSPHTPR